MNLALIGGDLIAALVVARLGWGKIVSRDSLRAKVAWVAAGLGLYVVVWYLLFVIATFAAGQVSPGA